VIQVKIAFVQDGVEAVDIVECRIFTPDSLATGIENKAVALTGKHIDVNPIRVIYVEDKLFIFMFDADDRVIAGYAMWVSGEEEA